jgi:hypothetical protein
MTTATAPDALKQLICRYDPQVFEVGRPEARIRLAGAAPEPFDVLLGAGPPQLVAADDGERPDALLTADPQTWSEIADDVRGGMAAYRAGRLRVRHDLHLGVGFLAARAACGLPPSTPPRGDCR